MVRSDGGAETHDYYKGGNTFTLRRCSIQSGRAAAGGPGGYLDGTDQPVYQSASAAAAHGP